MLPEIFGRLPCYRRIIKGSARQVPLLVTGDIKVFLTPGTEVNVRCPVYSLRVGEISPSEGYRLGVRHSGQVAQTERPDYALI